MNRIAFFLILAAAITHADDLTISDGTVYKDATIVSHDAVNATILYADGGATIPLAKLPADQQQKLGYDPSKAQAATAPTSDADKTAEQWKDYRKALDKYVAINGKLVQRDTSGVLSVSVKLNHLAEVKDSSGQSLGRGSFVDIADATPAAPTDPPASHPTDSTLYLKGYVLNDDKPVKVDVVKTGATETGGVYYTVIEPFDFAFWKKAGEPK